MVEISVTSKFIADAISDNTWTLGNNVIYDLCRNHPEHKRGDEIAAKIWLIGRGYAASIERRKEIQEEARGDNFFLKRVIPIIQESEIDFWISEVKTEPADRDDVALKTHKKVQDLFCKISGLNKRSLASKYLHFHLPNKFFFYDTRAANALTALAKGSKSQKTSDQHDAAYARFVGKCRHLKDDFSKSAGRNLTPREFDQILLEYIRQRDGR